MPKPRRCRRCGRCRRVLLLLLTAGAAYLVVQWLRARSPRTGLVREEPRASVPPTPTVAAPGPAPLTPREGSRTGAAPAPDAGDTGSSSPPGAAVREPAPSPGPPDPEGGVATWVDPVDGECPPSHPVKAKLTSGIYHVPGGLSYARTRPDRCYRDAEAAETDGLRAARR